MMTFRLHASVLAIVCAAALLQSCGGALGPEPVTGTILPPAVTSISPSSGALGAIVPVTITGTGFVAGTTVTIDPAGITVTALTIVNSTTMTATLLVLPTSDFGTHNLTVRTSAGADSKSIFTVVGAPPVLSSLSPDNGVPGFSDVMQIVGSSFEPGNTTLVISGTGVTLTGVLAPTTKGLVALVTVANDAVAGPRTITAKTPSGGTSNALTFTVKNLPPTLQNVAPASGSVNSVAAVTLTGINIVSGTTTVSVDGTGVTAGTVTVLDATRISVPLTIASSAAAGVRHVTVTTPGGTSNGLNFTVLAP